MNGRRLDTTRREIFRLRYFCNDVSLPSDMFLRYLSTIAIKEELLVKLSRQKSLQPMTKVSYVLSVEELQEMDKLREDISRSLFSRRAVRKILRERNKQKGEAQEGEEKGKDG